MSQDFPEVIFLSNDFFLSFSLDDDDDECPLDDPELGLRRHVKARALASLQITL